MQTRCLFVLPSLGAGGAERVATTLLRHLDVGRMELHLAVVCGRDSLRSDLPAHVVVHEMKADRVSRGMVPFVRTVRRLNPDVVISFGSHLNLACTLARRTWPRRTRLIVRETATWRHRQSQTRWPRLQRMWFAAGYRQADQVLCQTPFMKRDLAENLRLPDDRLPIIPNPVDFERIDRLANEDSGKLAGAGPHLLVLGGLRPVKCVVDVLAAFSGLVARRPEARLHVLGDGPLSDSLHLSAHRLGIVDQVDFAGFQPNPFAWLRRADLLVNASSSESSPNGVLEAVACGCPLAVRRQYGGTYEMLQYLGLRDRYVKRLDEWRDQWFERPGQESRLRAERRYAIRRVTNQYERLLAG